jgi:hypothetical protein
MPPTKPIDFDPEAPVRWSSLAPAVGGLLKRVYTGTGTPLVTFERMRTSLGISARDWQWISLLQ